MGTHWFCMLIIGLMIFSILTSCENNEKKYHVLPHNNGKIARLEYENHTYIGWTCNFGAGLVHDPDCKCSKDIIPKELGKAEEKK